jgi:hypothetical protein
MPVLARELDLIVAIKRDIAAVGLVGEADAWLLLYLAYSSRKLNKPISVIVKGPSGSGKDEIQRRPANLMPPEDVIDAMSITPQSLFYGEPGWLAHKIVLGGERKHEDDDAQRDRTAAIRQMLGHGYITKQTVKCQGQHIRQDGPICYTETTTKDSIFREDANRCLQISTDASKQQTRKVLVAQAVRYRPGPDSAGLKVDEVKQRHNEFQQALENVEVRIPYQEILAATMPVGKVEVRRLFGYVLGLIEVTAYLHQHQRGRNRWGQLEATTEDYAIARRLIIGPLHTAIGLGADHAKCVTFFRTLPNGEFDSHQAAQAMEAGSRKVTHERLDKLTEMGLIKCVAESAGNKPARWRRTGTSIDELILPNVATIRDACVTALPEG